MLPHLHEKGCQTNTFSPSPFPIFSTALIAIGQYSSTIETVDAGWCKDITDQGATQIAQSSKSLRYLGLMRCDKVTRLVPAGVRLSCQYFVSVVMLGTFGKISVSTSIDAR